MVSPGPAVAGFCVRNFPFCLSVKLVSFLNLSFLPDQMNVFWHRPSRKSSAFMYITFRMSSNGTKEGLPSFSQSAAMVSSQVSTSRVQHTIRAIFPHIKVKKTLLSKREKDILVAGEGKGGSVCLTLCLCVWLNHYHYWTYRRSGGHGCVNTQCWYVSRPRYFFPFLTVFLFYYYYFFYW